jgi:GntR family transcriptional repressor for pyruvate dehydrogenase complex
LPPIKRLNVVDYIVEEMLTRIRSGEFKKGEKIPPEKVLTKEFGVSRTSLREAFKKLELLGLITIRQGDGTYLNDTQRDKIIQIELNKLLRINDIDITEYLEARKCIEITAVGLAARRAEEKDISLLTALVERFENENNTPEVCMELDFEFHQAIVRIADNRFLTKFWFCLAYLIKEQQIRSNYIPEALKSNMKFHRELLQAIKERNSKSAMRLMEEHLDLIVGRFIKEVSRKIVDNNNQV